MRRVRIAKFTMSSKEKIKKKVKPVSFYVKKLDLILSARIHERDKGKKCIDGCGRAGEQNGHFRRRELMSTRFHPKNCNLQSTYCNCWLSGNEYAYAEGLDKKWGEGTAKELYRLSKKTKQWTREDLIYLIEESKDGMEAYENAYYVLTEAL